MLKMFFYFCFPKYFTSFVNVDGVALANFEFLLAMNNVTHT